MYNSLAFKTGSKNSGICTVKIIPKEWVANLFAIDFDSGKVLTALTLQPGREYIDLNFTADSYAYEEKPKSNKSGPYFEVTCNGTLNDLDAVSQQILESLKNHEFICLVKDRNKKEKIVGNPLYGMRLQMGYKQANSSGGTEVQSIDLTMDCEDRPPFYQP